MSKKCDIIQDMLPLYVDEVCSEAAAEMVKEHLATCAECNKIYQQMLSHTNEDMLHVESESVVKRHENKEKKKNRRNIAIAVIVTIVLLGSILGGYFFARNLPVDWDAGACGGGYATFIFDKYSNELVKKYLDGSDNKDNIISIEAVRGSQTAEWEGQTIFLQFDIKYQNSNQEEVTERLRFIGQRTWFDTYDWSGAIIEGYALEVTENSVGEIGRETYNFPVEISEDDANALSEIINGGTWVEEPADCESDCVINLKGHWTHYNSESGTLNKYNLKDMSVYSSKVQEVSGKSFVLSEEDRATVNSILEKYITLGFESN